MEYASFHVKVLLCEWLMIMSIAWIKCQVLFANVLFSRIDNRILVNLGPADEPICKYRKTSNISRTLVGNNIVDN